MSNKTLDKINILDKELRQLFPTRMWDNNQTICTIRMFGGFEFFNTRPYHNYETWSEGYEVTSPIYPSIKVTSEDLDDAIMKFKEAIVAYKLSSAE